MLFSHGSGRHGPRNRYVARLLNEAKLATLLVDLLTPEEDEIDPRAAVGLFQYTPTRQTNYRSDRLAGANPGYQGIADRLLRGEHGRHGRPGGGHMHADLIRAIVTRGGRPDLAGTALTLVRAPTLLIVGDNDFEALELNRQATKQLRYEKKIALVPGAIHLFEEPGALNDVASWARMWFMRYFPN